MPLTPVQKELQRIAADYRRFHLFRTLSFCWAALLLAGVAILLIDRFFDLAIPFAFPALLLLAIGSFIVTFISTRRLQFGIRDVARAVEKEDPRLNSVLLAAAEQEPDQATGEFNFLQARVLREALAANKRSPWHQRFTERLFFAQCGQVLLLAMLVFLFLAMGLAPSAPEREAARRSTVVITPGDAPVEKGSSVAIVAEFPAAPDGEVILLYKTRSQGERSITMTRGLDDPLYGATLTGLQEDAEYTVRYTGGLSTSYKLTVFEYPRLERADAALEFPSFTQFPPRKIEDTRRLTAVEGTRVDYSFYLNKPVTSARLVSPDAGEIDLEPDPAQSNLLRSAFVLQRDGRYSLELIDSDGRTNRVPADFHFVALPNETPQMKLLAPRDDTRVSRLQELLFQAELQDDFGLVSYGLTYTIPGGEDKVLRLSVPNATNETGLVSSPHEKRSFNYLLALEQLSIEPRELISFHLWAEDFGPDGEIRRSTSDLFFAEIRPFEEIFREDNSGGANENQQAQGGQAGNQAAQLLELQREIIQATWNIRRRESPAQLSSKYAEDVEVVRDSQRSALQQATRMLERLQDEQSRVFGENAVSAMESAIEELADAGKGSLDPLTPALDFEQAAQQALYKLQAREFQVSRGQPGQPGQAGGQQRAQRQLDQLEMRQEENRYQSLSQAAPMQSPEQRENVQVLNRLKELARRQQDMSERLKELQSALNLASNQEEREEIERMLKRLQDEQRQILQDTDELRQRMDRPENRSRMAEARERLDQTRQEARDAAQQLERRDIGQALSSSSRAQNELNELTDDFRDATSSQFTEEMRNLRQQSRELAAGQDELLQRLRDQQSARRTLSDQGETQEMLDALARQQQALTNVLTGMREITEQAEAAEPLLSRQLYDTFRRVAQTDPESSLEIASRLAQRGFPGDAAQAAERASDPIRALNEGIERAAESVLGNEAEALRMAERVLDDLANRVERELRSAGQSTNQLALNRRYFPHIPLDEMGEPLSTNRTATGSSAQGNNAQQEPGSENEPGSSQSRTSQNGEAREGQSSSSPGQGESQEGQPGENGGEPSPGQSGQPGEGQGQQQGQGGQPGQNNQPGESQQGSAQGGGQTPGSQPGNQPGGQRQESGQAQNQGGGQPGGGQPGGDQPGGNQQGGGGQRGGNFFENWAAGGDQNAGGGGGSRGPLTGDDFREWSDRLRDVEEMLQDPALRADVAQVLDRARAMRGEYTRQSTPPRWELVDMGIVQPLRIVQTRVVEELARQNSREALVPVDRDPVPRRYSDAVSRYYERLGSE